MELRAPDPAEIWSGVVTIDPELLPAEGTPLETVELWIDGRPVASAPAGKPLEWDTRTVEDGGHELRLVAVEDSPIETRSVYRTTVSVFNHDRRIVVEEFPAEVLYEQAVEIIGHAAGAKAVELHRGHQLIAAGDAQDGRWRLSVPARVLGMGEARLRVRAVFAGGQGVRSLPLTIRVGQPARLLAAAIPKPVTPGLLALVQDTQGGVRELQIDKLGGRAEARDTLAEILQISTSDVVFCEYERGFLPLY